MRLCDLISARVGGPAKATASGERLANHLANVMATRVFAEPEQFVLELVVNACDAYRALQGREATGKFGVGMFSMFAMLFANPRAVVVITSQTETEHFTFDVCCVEGGLQVSERTPLRQPVLSADCRQRGVMVEVRGLTTSYSKLLKQLDRVRYVRGVRIVLSLAQRSEHLTDFALFDPCVRVLVSHTRVTVIDNALGFSRDTFFSVELVPSVSSKRVLRTSLREPQNPRSGPRLLQRCHTVSEFVITVNDIVVVHLETRQAYTWASVFLVQLESWTRLPLDRNDVLWHEEEVAVFEDQLRLLVTQLAMSRTITTFCDLLELLDAYTVHCQQAALTAAIVRVKRFVYEFEHVILVPSFEPRRSDEHRCQGSAHRRSEALYQALQRHLPHVKFMQHPNPRLYETERRLDALLRPRALTNVFHLKLVYPLPSLQKWTTGALSQYLFVDPALLAQPCFRETMVLSDPHTVLFPVESKAALAFHKVLVQKLWPKIPLVIFQAIANFRMTWLAKTETVRVCFDFESAFVPMFMRAYVFDAEEQTLALIRHCNAKISSLDLTEPYGSKVQMAVLTETVLFKPSKDRHIRSYDWRNWRKKGSLTRDDLGFLANLQRDLFFPLLDLMATGNLFATLYVPDFLQASLDPGDLALDALSQAGRCEFMSGLRACLTAEEALTFAALFSHCMLIPRGINLGAKGIGHFIVKEMRHRASSHELTAMLTACFRHFVSNKAITSVLQSPIVRACKEYCQAKFVRDSDEPRCLGNVHRTFVTSARSLIALAFARNLEDPAVAIEEYFASPRVESKEELRISELAVNHGTSREFMFAALTELIQNSTDARQANKPGTRHVLFDVDHQSVAVTDFVGIEDSCLLALLIPFLSTKHANNAATTGEMGSGFFTCFRQPHVRTVTIDTCRDGMQTLIRAAPVVDGESRVVDISYDVRRSSQTTINHTTVSILLDDRPEERASLLADAHTYARNFLAYHSLEVLMNGRSIQASCDVVLQSEIGKVFLLQDASVVSFV